MFMIYFFTSIQVHLGKEAYMELAQPEIIQVLRKRADLNQGAFGAKAFNTTFESGRTKVKNIELGKQVPTRDDLKKMAKVLGVPLSTMTPGKKAKTRESPPPGEGVFIVRKVLDLFSGLDVYLEILNKAVMLDDHELVRYISKKVSNLLTVRIGEKAASG